VEALRWMEIQFEDVRARIIEQWEKFQRGSDDELDTPPPSSPSDIPIAP
jgi:hypothetical protein